MRRRDFLGLVGGAAAAWPIAARAQQPTMPIIGYMSARSPEDTVQVLKAFHKGLGEGGFVSDGNVKVEYPLGPRAITAGYRLSPQSFSATARNRAW